MPQANNPKNRWAIDLSHGKSSPSVKGPVAPPVHRPQQLPKVLQTKLSKLPVAPPVYRPEAKKLVQPKSISQLRTSPAAPPVYRPEQKRVAQPKMAAAKQVHTSPKPAPVSQAKQVNTQLKVAAQTKPKTFVPRANTKPATIQRYSVLPPERVMDEFPRMVGRREPQPPYAVVASGKFLAQQSSPQWANNKAHDFLTAMGGDQASIVSGRLGVSLRLSDDGNMAIENSDLVSRQPKEFYATSTIVRESNLALERVGARVRLVKGAHALTVVTAWRQVIALYAVTPVFEKLPPQNCNAMAAQVIGSDPIRTSWLAAGGMTAAKKIAGKNAPSYSLLSGAKTHDPDVYVKLEALKAKVEEALVEEYVGQLPHSHDIMEREKINQYAKPGVGEAFMIGTLGRPTSQNGGTATVLDLESREQRVLGWGYHFAGVVAVSGNDRVTLENYARGDDRRDDPDPRWYFQMYGGSAGQTFYDFHKAKREFSNPVVVGVGK